MKHAQSISNQNAVRVTERYLYWMIKPSACTMLLFSQLPSY